jgi:putative ABC transport system permease protein
MKRTLRMLAASPGFTTVALISLGLGICIATCALSEMNGMVLRHLPGVAKPNELVALETPTSYPTYKRYRDLTDLFSSTAAYVAPVPFAVSFDGRTERTWGHLVTPSYFSTFEVRPALGRLFDQQEKYPGQSPTVIVSYRFWQEHLGSDRAVIGKTLHINGQPAAVIGVGPKDFLGASPSLFYADLWMPMGHGRTSQAPEPSNWRRRLRLIRGLSPWEEVLPRNWPTMHWNAAI